MFKVSKNKSFIISAGGMYMQASSQKNLCTMDKAQKRYVLGFKVLQLILPDAFNCQTAFS
ncbi:hypothetical protein ABE28_000915 [Peribacillus muralis]|uniref:Uncharacterized protein n=1 Tax=Peribacillus muralis TaxID=264697 RepID=A0A1B3XI88_9BACI|nr:hypothetical protein ABE28_000915 [Peribacillus muralis]